MDINKKFPLISRFMLFGFLPLFLLTAIGYYKYFVLPVPPYASSVIYEATGNNTQIQRNDFGIVDITANTQQDMYFATGYAHAQDRMWQLEIQRRTARGELAEVLGQGGVEMDIWMRSLRIYDSTENIEQILSADALASLKAYRDGINQWLSEQHQLPVEFTLLGFQPEPWAVRDSLAWIKVFALNLSVNFYQEMQRYVAIKNLSPKLASLIFKDLKQDNRKKEDLMLLQFNIDASLLSNYRTQGLKFGGENAGSNAWVVSGEHTESGSAILANDPHLQLSTPSLWYIINQKYQSQEISGFSLIGLPIVIFGKNDSIAWGATSMQADVQDLTMETLKPDEPNKYLYGSQWLELEKSHQQIKIKQAFPSSIRASLQPEQIVIRSTKRGVLISDIFSESDFSGSLMWNANVDKDTSYEAFYRLNYAKNWQEFRNALKFHISPALNIFYIDKLDNIGMQGAGKIPIRKQGRGNLPVFLDDGETNWSGTIPFDEMPSEFNPERGYIVNANNKVESRELSHFISYDFASPERANRITQLITEKISSGEKIALDYVADMQTDVKDLSVQRLYRLLHQIKVESPRLQAIINALQDWDFQADASSVQAAIFYMWTKNVRNRILEGEISSNSIRPNETADLQSIIGRVSHDDLADLLANANQFCDTTKKLDSLHCGDAILSSLRDTDTELTILFGKDIRDWKWGRLQETEFNHTPLSQINLVKNYFGRIISDDGSPHTVDLAVGHFIDKKGFKKMLGSTFRQVISFESDKTVHRLMMGTGQSGHVASKNYGDMMPKFLNGDLIEISPLKQAMFIK